MEREKSKKKIKIKKQTVMG